MKKVFASILIIAYVFLFLCACFVFLTIGGSLAVYYGYENLLTVGSVLGFIIGLAVGMPILYSDINVIYTKFWRKYDR